VATYTLAFRHFTKATDVFETLSLAPPDPILGLTDAFNRDPRPHKINLGVGVYQDASGRTPILECVKRAEERLLKSEASKEYLGIAGSIVFASEAAKLLFGAEHDVIRSKRFATAQTPGGTGALRVAADFLKSALPDATVWLSDPTWPNHPSIFKAAGLKTAVYPYFDAATNALAADAMLEALTHVPAGDVVLLHGCCHNPSGVDPTSQEWSRIADVLAPRGVLPLVDLAYQGFGDGLVEDAVGVTSLARSQADMMVCSSYSKNFGLYNERVGALTVVGRDEKSVQAAMSHIKQSIRANYSNPPSHGAAIVATILTDPRLRAEWEVELAAMRDRINGMRRLFVETLARQGAGRDFSFIKRQRGMFSFSGLNRTQVDRLRDEHAIYIVGSGRINVAGMTETNMDRLCAAIVGVL
jgi:aspartate/tyrosine/aromatic aminotransferase